MLRRLTACMTAAIALALLSTSCDKTASTTATSGVLFMSCDESFENIMEQEIEVFEYNYPDATIACRYMPQSEVIDSLMQFKTTCAVISRQLTEKEMAHLKKEKPATRQMQIAVDAVALIVNKENPINLLTTSEVADVLSGRDSLWTDLWPSELGKINVYFDHSGSSTVQFMRDKVLSGQPFGPNVHAQGSIPEVFKAVERDKNAIGIVGVAWLTTDMGAADMPDSDRRKMVAALSEESKSEESIEAPNFSESIKVLLIRRDNELDAYKPYQQYIYDGRYPYTRPIWMVSTASAHAIGGGFYAYVTGYEGQKIISMTGIMPARVKSRIVELK